ncbi:MAG: outer membrane protein assembly factor BamB [Methylococcales symbiont of Iophon sp. n. MRB-2018]|nr:MAG: outer membrane protein assembly factor BamB [Methylococcales symbiont of Iophon sp. n. MRB-2018]KAF3980257.1 MAG: outer membrane protein assembly factor BamB [Methylococcales symbiont of Iophon sp. n. MRB-2018]
MKKIKTYFTSFVITSITALLLSACATFEAGTELVSGVSSYFLGGSDNKILPAELVDYEAEIEIDILWQESIGAGTDEQFLNLVLAISYGKILVAERKGSVQALDIKTGDLIWETDTNYSFSAGPGIGGKTVVLATSNAEVIALDFDTGLQKWQVLVSSEVLANPVIDNGIVIIRTTDGKVVALSEEDGSELWLFERSVPALSIRGTGSPIIVGEHVIIGYANGKLIALRLIDGKNIWETSIVIPSGRTEIERLVDLDVDPVETDGVIFISSFQGGTSAVLEIDGDVLWRNKDVSSYSGLSYDWRYLYVSDAEDHVWQLDQRNGTSLWKQNELNHRTLTAPVAYDEYIVVGDFRGYIHWLARSDGRQLGRIKVSRQGIDAKLVVVDDTVFSYSKDGTLSALKARLF